MDGNGSGLTEQDLTARRLKMVDEQIYGRDVRDHRVLAAMRKVPRHRFVPPSEVAHAYGDYPLPIGNEQTISQPFIVASMSEYLQLDKLSTVLEIGTGCGYQTAVLAELAATVYTIEYIADLQERAREVLGELGYTNVAFLTGDGSHGWPQAAPYDGIIVTAAAPRVPRSLEEQLAEGGRMVIPVIVDGADLQELLLVTKQGGELHRRTLYQVRFVPMRGAIEG